MSRKKPTQFPGVAPEEKAFRRSDGYYFRGEKLEPYSFLRETTVMALLREMGTIAQVELAAGLWVLHQPDSVCMEARKEPSKFAAKVDLWAEENQIGFMAPNFKGAKEVYEAVCADRNAVASRPIVEKSGEDDSEMGN